MAAQPERSGRLEAVNRDRQAARFGFRLEPIGYVRTRYKHLEETPTQAPLNDDERGLLVVYPRYAPALAGLAEFETRSSSRSSTASPRSSRTARANWFRCRSCSSTPASRSASSRPASRSGQTGWPDRNVGSIRGGWYRRVSIVHAGGVLAGHRSLERAGVLRRQVEEELP